MSIDNVDDIEPNPDPEPTPSPMVNSVVNNVVNNVVSDVVNDVNMDDVGNVVDVDSVSNVANVSIPFNYIYDSKYSKVDDSCCAFTHAGDSTVFLDKQITEGIFQWSMIIIYKDYGLSEFCLGVASTALVSKLKNTLIGVSSGSCGFTFWRSDNRELFSTFAGTNSNDGMVISGKETCVRNGSTVMAELNMEESTLCFFVNGRKVPHIITEIPASVYMGMSGHFRSYSFRNHSFTTVSFCRVSAPTAASQVWCKLHTVR